MTVVQNTTNSGLLDHFSMCCDGVHLSSHALGGATVIAATGEIDACNIHHLSDYVPHYLAGDRPVVVDLTDLDFLGAQGIPALLAINERCGEAGVDWALVPSHAVRRLLRVCVKDGQLPTVSSVAQALQRFSSSKGTQPLLKLITESS